MQAERGEVFRISRWVPILLPVGVVACASVQVTTRGATRPIVASMQPVSMPPPATEPADRELEASAAALLERGFAHFQSNHDQQASAAFRAAIGTDNLNDAGRALAYWHIYMAERSEGNSNGSADALASFVVVAEDVIEVRDSLRYAVDEGGDFVDRFALKYRLSRARAELAAAWADRASYFGRSERHAIRIQDRNEIHFFVEMAPPCADSMSREIDRGEVTEYDGHSVERITIRCRAQAEGVNYYFRSAL